MWKISIVAQDDLSCRFDHPHSADLDNSYPNQRMTILPLRPERRILLIRDSTIEQGFELLL